MVQAIAPDRRAAPASATEERRHDLWWVIALTGVAIALRAIALDAELWLDEINALEASIRPPLAQILTTYGSDNQHTLYSALAHLSAAAFGESAWSVRLPAMLFGAATVPAVYWLGLKVADRREALLAAALLAVSYHHIWFSQNARGYTGVALVTVLATALLIEGIRTQRRGPFLGYAVVVALGAYMHLTGIFLAVSHALVCAVLVGAGGALPAGPGALPGTRRRLDWRLPLLGFGAAAGLTLLLYAPILDQVIWWFTERPSNFEGVSTPGWAMREALRVLGASAGALPVLAAGGAVFLVGLASYARRSPAVFFLFAVPGAVTLVLPLLIRGTMYPRFFFYLAGIALLVVVRGAVETGGWLARAAGRPEHARLAGTVLACLAIAASTMTVPRNYRYPKQAFRGAMAWMESARGPGDVVAVAGTAAGVYRGFYDAPYPEVVTRADLLAQAPPAGSLWILYTMPQYLPRFAPELAPLLPAECAERQIFPGTLGGGYVYACRVNTDGGVGS